MRSSELLRDVAHRPYELPAGRWVMRQTWTDLLFAHWSIASDMLRPYLPTGLALDTFEGRAWLGVVPFRMSGIRPRGRKCWSGRWLVSANLTPSRSAEIVRASLVVS